MPLSIDDREEIQSFLSYVEDALVDDDRYGTTHRHEGKGDTPCALRFAATDKCWFEVDVDPSNRKAYVGLCTNDSETFTEITQEITESELTPTSLLEHALQGMGHHSQQITVDRFSGSDNMAGYRSPIELDELRELGRDDIRNQTLRILEAYLIAFGPALLIEDEEEQTA